LDLRIHRLRSLINLVQKVRNGLNSKIHPLAEICVREVSDLQIVLRIQPCLLAERGDRVVVKARPRIFPAIEVRHPIGNVDVDPIYPGLGDLTDPLHVDLPPLRSIRTNPDILVALSNPECRSPSENRRLSRKLPLQPIRMFLRERVWG